MGIPSFANNNNNDPEESTSTWDSFMEYSAPAALLLVALVLIICGLKKLHGYCRARRSLAQEQRFSIARQLDIELQSQVLPPSQPSQSATKSQPTTTTTTTTSTT